MENNVGLLVLVIVVCIGGSFIYKKWITEGTLKKLYKFKMQRNTEEFIKLLNSPYLKFNFSKFTLYWMQLSYFLDYKMTREVEETFRQQDVIKMTSDEQATVYFRMYTYYIEINQIQKAEALYNILNNCIQSSKDSKINALEKEVNQLKIVYCDKDSTQIKKIEEDIESCTDDELKSVGYFRIAKLYHYQGNEDKVNNYLQLAIDKTRIETNKESLEEMKKDHKKLD